MSRSAMLILAVAALGCYGVAASSVPANAGPWGHNQFGTNIQAGNCDCTPAPIPQQAAQQAPTTVAKQANPAAMQNGEGPPATKQR